MDIPDLHLSHPTGLRARAFNRVERAVEPWLDVLAEVVLDAAREVAIIKSSPAGLIKAHELAQQLTKAGAEVTIDIVIEEVRYSAIGLEALHAEVRQRIDDWLGPQAPSVTGSEANTRLNAVIVDLDDPMSDNSIKATRQRWGSDVRLRFSPGSRLIEQ